MLNNKTSLKQNTSGYLIFQRLVSKTKALGGGSLCGGEVMKDD
jgi:hypothetical protein